MTPSELLRFKGAVVIQQEHWLWIGDLGELPLARKLAYEHFKTKLRPEESLATTCDVLNCVLPKHLRAESATPAVSEFTVGELQALEALRKRAQHAVVEEDPGQELLRWLAAHGVGRSVDPPAVPPGSAPLDQHGDEPGGSGSVCL